MGVGGVGALTKNRAYANAMRSSLRPCSKRIYKVIIVISAKIFSKTDITKLIYFRFLNTIQILINNQNLNFALRMNPSNLIHILEYLGENNSQLNQDLYVASQFNLFNQKFEGYFVEVGGANGIDLSNTYLLEKEFGWKGIIVEPAKIWHEMLLKKIDPV